MQRKEEHKLEQGITRRRVGHIECEACGMIFGLWHGRGINLKDYIESIASSFWRHLIKEHRELVLWE